MSPVDRLVEQAIQQGHPRKVADEAVLAAVATIIGTTRRREVARDRKAA